MQEIEYDEEGRGISGPKGVTLVMGGDGMYGKYGYGETLAKAKTAFRGAGGKLGLGHSVFHFDTDTEFLGVTQMGQFRYRGNAPVENSIAPRKTAARR